MLSIKFGKRNSNWKSRMSQLKYFLKSSRFKIVLFAGTRQHYEQREWTWIRAILPVLWRFSSYHRIRQETEEFRTVQLECGSRWLVSLLMEVNGNRPPLMKASFICFVRNIHVKFEMETKRKQKLDMYIWIFTMHKIKKRSNNKCLCNEALEMFFLVTI